MENRRVVVTGIGILADNGRTLREYRDNCYQLVSGLKKCTVFDASMLQTDIVGQIDMELPYENQSPGEKCRTESIVEYCLENMLRDGGMTKEYISSLNERAALSFGTSLQNAEKVMSYVKRKNQGYKDSAWITNIANLQADIKNYLGIMGECYTTTTACAASTTACGIGFDLIKANIADLVIVGGVDPLNEYSLYGFNTLKALSKSQCKPFDVNRDGINIGEGGAFLILETLEKAKERNAKIYAEICGYGINNDAYHITSPDPNGEGAVLSMRMAIDSSNITVEDIDYINAHGTGTTLNDSMEVKAINELFDSTNKKVLVSATKACIGHCLAAAGILELVITILMLKDNKVMGNASLTEPMDCGESVELIREIKEADLTYALSNSFAFAGNTASLLIKKYQDE